MKSLAKNLIAATSADAGSRVLGFLVTAYLARVLGPPAFGLVSIGLSVLGYAYLFAGPGLNVFGTRQIAAGSTAGSIHPGEIVFLRVVLAVVSVALFCVGTFAVYGVSNEWLTVAIFVCAAIPMAAAGEWYLQGKNAITQLAFARLSMYAAYLILVVLFVRQADDVAWSALAFAGSTCVIALMTLFFMHRTEPRIVLPVGIEQGWAILRESFPLGVSTILAQTVLNLPVLIVGAILSTADAGLFGSAMKLVFFALMLDRVFYLLFLPAASRSAALEQFPALVRIAMKSVLFIAVPVTLIAIAYASPITVLVYGTGYEAAAPVFAAAMPYFVFTVSSTVLMTVLFAIRQEKAYLAGLSIGTTVLVILSLGLTAFLGTLGSAIALSVSELLMVVLLARSVKALASITCGGILLAYLGAALVAIVVFVLCAGLPAGLQPTTALVAYLLSLAGLKGFTIDDLRFLLQRIA